MGSTINKMGKRGIFLILAVLTLVLSLNQFVLAVNVQNCTDITSGGNYFLTSPIDEQVGNPIVTDACFSLRADNILFDCQNFDNYIKGTSTHADTIYSNAFITQTGRSNITIRNCNISNIWRTGGSNSAGIHVSDGISGGINGLTIENVLFEGENIRAIVLDKSSKVNITNVVVNGTVGDFGIQTKGTVSSNSKLLNFTNITIDVTNGITRMLITFTSKSTFTDINLIGYPSLSAVYNFAMQNSTLNNFTRIVSSGGYKYGFDIEKGVNNSIFYGINSTYSGLAGLLMGVDCYNNTVENSYFASNGLGGMEISSSAFNRVSENLFIRNYIENNTAYGIFLGADKNNFTQNIIQSNKAGGGYNGEGILSWCCGDQFNYIYDNFFNNTINTGITSAGTNANFWNITYQAKSNFVGGNYTGGNFWADPTGTGFSQTCADVNNDFICDSSYSLFSANNTDYLPLVFVSMTPPISNPVISGIAITPSPAYSNSTLNCSATYTSPVGRSGILAISWYNNVTLYSYSLYSVESGDLASQIVPSGIQAQGEAWTCSVNATDNMSLLSNILATGITISAIPTGNSLPTITAVGISECCITPLDTITFTIYATDPEGDPIGYAYKCLDTDPMSAFTSINNGSCTYNNEGNFILTVYANDTNHTTWNSFSQGINAFPDITGVCGGMCLQTDLIKIGDKNSGLMPQVYFGTLAFFEQTLSPMLIVGMVIFITLIMIMVGVIFRRIAQKVVDLGN